MTTTTLSVSGLSTLDNTTSLTATQTARPDLHELDSSLCSDENPSVPQDIHPWATRTDRFTGLPVVPPSLRNTPSPTSTTSSLTAASDSSFESIDDVRLGSVVNGGLTSDGSRLKPDGDIGPLSDDPQTSVGGLPVNVTEVSQTLRDRHLDSLEDDATASTPPTEDVGVVSSADTTLADEDALPRNPIEFMDFSFVVDCEEQCWLEQEAGGAQRGSDQGLSDPSPPASPATAYWTPTSSRSQTPDCTAGVESCASSASVFVTAPSTPMRTTHAHGEHAGTEPFTSRQTLDSWEAGRSRFYPLWSSSDTWTLVEYPMHGRTLSVC